MASPIVKEFEASEITPEEIQAHLNKHMPFVVRNWFKEANNFLKEDIWQYEKARVLKLLPGEDTIIGKGVKTYETTKSTYAEAFETIRNQKDGNMYYLFGGGVTKVFVDKLPWPKTVTIGNVYAASKGVRTKAHIDMWDVMHIQCAGEKTWWLAAPSDYPYMYVVDDVEKGVTRRCLIDLENPDVEKYPLFKKVQSTKVTTKEGDFFYLPPLWWHEVEAQSFSMSINTVIKHPIWFHYLTHLRWHYYAFISEYIYGSSRRIKRDFFKAAGQTHKRQG